MMAIRFEVSDEAVKLLAEMVRRHRERVSTSAHAKPERDAA